MKSMCSTAAVVSLAILAGCGRNEQTKTDSATETPVIARQLGTNVDAALAIRTNAPALRNDFVGAADRKLKDLDAQINELSQKAATLKDDARTRADQALASLREQRAVVSAKFDEVKKAGAEGWQNLKAGFDSAMAELEKAYENAKSKLSEP